MNQMIFPPRYKHIVSNYISSETCVEKSHKDLFRAFENRTRQTLQFVTDKNEEKSTEMYSFCGLNRTAKGVQIPYFFDDQQDILFNVKGCLMVKDGGA